MFHQLFAFKGIHHIVELFKADENFVNVIAGSFSASIACFFALASIRLFSAIFDFIVHLVKPLVKVRFADDVMAVIRVE